MTNKTVRQVVVATPVINEVEFIGERKEMGEILGVFKAVWQKHFDEASADEIVATRAKSIPPFVKLILGPFNAVANDKEFVLQKIPNLEFDDTALLLADRYHSMLVRVLKSSGVHPDDIAGCVKVDGKRPKIPRITKKLVLITELLSRIVYCMLCEDMFGTKNGGELIEVLDEFIDQLTQQRHLEDEQSQRLVQVLAEGETHNNWVEDFRMSVEYTDLVTKHMQAIEGVSTYFYANLHILRALLVLELGNRGVGAPKIAVGSLEQEQVMDTLQEIELKYFMKGLKNNKDKVSIFLEKVKTEIIEKMKFARMKTKIEQGEAACPKKVLAECRQHWDSLDQDAQFKLIYQHCLRPIKQQFVRIKKNHQAAVELILVGAEIPFDSDAGRRILGLYDCEQRTLSLKSSVGRIRRSFNLFGWIVIIGKAINFTLIYKMIISCTKKSISHFTCPSYYTLGQRQQVRGYFTAIKRANIHLHSLQLRDLGNHEVIEAISAQVVLHVQDIFTVTKYAMVWHPEFADNTLIAEQRFNDIAKLAVPKSKQQEEKVLANPVAPEVPKEIKIVHVSFADLRMIRCRKAINFKLDTQKVTSAIWGWEALHMSEKAEKIKVAANKFNQELIEPSANAWMLYFRLLGLVLVAGTHTGVPMKTTYSLDMLSSLLTSNQSIMNYIEECLLQVHRWAVQHDQYLGSRGKRVCSHMGAELNAIRRDVGSLSITLMRAVLLELRTWVLKNKTFNSPDYELAKDFKFHYRLSSSIWEKRSADIAKNREVLTTSDNETIVLPKPDADMPCPIALQIH